MFGKQVVVIDKFIQVALIGNHSQVTQVVTLTQLVGQLVIQVIQELTLKVHQQLMLTYHHTILLRILSNMLKVELLQKDRKEKLVLQVLVVALVIKDKKVK